GQLYRLGCPISWPALYPTPSRCVSLPAYAWQRERFWLEAKPPVPEAPLAAATLATSSRTAPAVIGGGGVGGEDGAAPGGAEIAKSAEMTETERRLAVIWRDVLRTPTVTPEDDFFRQGGHSLLAVRLLTRVRDEFRTTIPLASFALAPTVAGLGGMIDRGARFLAWSPLVPVQPQGSRPPFFCVTPILGTAFPYYKLAHLLADEQPFFALQPPALDRRQPAIASMAAMAAYYLEAIRTLQPSGPYSIGGWSFGAHVAYEMARQLQERGEAVRLVALIDAAAPIRSQTPSMVESAEFLARRVLPELGPYVRDFLFLRLAQPGAPGRGLPWLPWLPWLRNSGVAAVAAQASGVLALRHSGLFALVRALYCNTLAYARYRPQPSAGCVTLLKTSQGPKQRETDPTWGWSKLARGGVEVHDIPGAHMTLLQPPHVETVAATLSACLDRAR
ncbi:MAG: thioesterase domain-containing protein, partial [Chloroflexota bacterium]